MAMDLNAEAKVRAKLAALKSALEERSQGSDPARRGRLGAMQHQPRAASADAKHGAELKRIDAAIARLNDGNYGFCASCGKPIEDKRLDSDPATIHCALCGGDQQ